MSCPTFSQFELEDALYRVFPFGSQEEIAKRIGKSPGLISQYCNPHDSRESPLYKAAQMLAALAEIDPQAGREALELFNLFVHRSLPHEGGCTKTSAVEFIKEASDVSMTAITNEPLYQQWLEATQARDAAARHADNLLAMINAEKMEPNASRARISGNRVFAKNAVNGRKRA